MSYRTTIWAGVDIDVWGFEGVFRGILVGMVRRAVLAVLRTLAALT